MARAYRGDTFRAMAARPILSAAILVCATFAHASPRTDPTVGRSVFTGAATPHPTSVELNPAALGLGVVPELFFSLTGVADHYAIDRDTATAVDGTEVGAGGIFAAIFRPGTRYAVSLEVRTPPPELFPQDKKELGYFSLGKRQRDLLVSIAATIKATSRLYFGATLTHHNTFLRLRYARDTGAERGEAAENPDSAELYDVGVNSPYFSTSNLKFSVGFLARIYKQVWLGVGYHTPPGFNLQTELEGNVEITRAPRDGGAKLPGDAIVDVSYPASVDAEVTAQLPQLFELHIGGRWEDLSRMQAYDTRVTGSQIVPNGIPEWQLRARGMHDSFAAWGGVDQVDYGQVTRFGGRIGFETSAVAPDRTTPLTIAPTSATLDLGMQVRLNSNAGGLGILIPNTIEFAYGLQYFLPTDVTASAFDPRFYAECAAAEFDYTTRACTAVRNGYAIADGDGSYRRMLHSIRIGLHYDLP
jgi:hypothetical protein